MRFSSGSQHHGPNLHSKAKSSKNLESMAKISLHALSVLKKYMTLFLGINFGRFCKSTALMVNCCAPLSHCTATGGLCLGKWQATKAVPCGRWTPARVRFVTSPFHCLHELDPIGSTNAAKLMSVPRLEIAKAVVCYSLMIWFCFLPQNLPSSAH